MAQRERLLLLFVATIVLAVPYQFATAADGDGVFGQYWGIRTGLNYSSWDGLGDVVPAGRGGEFKTNGVGIEMGAYTSIATVGTSWLFAGVEIGAMGFNTSLLESEPKLESALDAAHITTSLKFRFGESDRNYFDLDAGFGYYLASTKYIDCVAIPNCFASEADESVVGGYLGVSGRIWKGLVLGARIHQADFGTINAIGPNSGDLKGPIYTVSVVWDFGNW